MGGNEGGKCNYPTRLDTYGRGCAHDCRYCYAKSLLDFRNLWNPEEPSVADIGKIRKKVSQIAGSTVPVRLGGMTDCFQSAEKKYRVTYETIRALNRNRVPYLVVTKSPLVADNEYMDILDRELAHLQITVTTTDDGTSRSYEKAPLPSERIKAIEKLQENGFDVSLRFSPFIPGFIDYDWLNAVRCNKILIEFLRVNTWIKRWFDLDYSDWTVRQSGYQHLPLEKKKLLLRNITGFAQVSVCEDEDEAYEYWRMNVNHNPDDCCNLRRSDKDQGK